jgi:S-adenosylmethionine decarboxylase
MARLKLGVAAINGAKASERRAPARTVPVPVPVQNGVANDHFITQDGVTYAGNHLIIDLWEAEGLDDKARIEQAMKNAVKAAGATLLHIYLHVFEPGGGISGVAVLAESHISVHTWPERGYAAFDVFMCGTADTRKARDVLAAAFGSAQMVSAAFKRGAPFVTE